MMPRVPIDGFTSLQSSVSIEGSEAKLDSTKSRHNATSRRDKELPTGALEKLDLGALKGDDLSSHEAQE